MEYNDWGLLLGFSLAYTLLSCMLNKNNRIGARKRQTQPTYVRRQKWDVDTRVRVERPHDRVALHGVR